MSESKILGLNVKRIRTEKGLSLGQLAELCDVSKMVLSQIERGSSNPTLSTIWKIAVGLNVPYTALLESNAEPAQAQLRVQHRSTVPLHSLEEGDYRSLIYYSCSETCPFDFFTVELEPGASKESAHTKDSTEYVYVEQGSLELKVGEETISMIEGDSVKFDASQKHIYTNLGKGLLRIITIVTYH